MLELIKTKATFANVVSCVALFVALGGSAYAGLRLNEGSVGTRQLKDDAVRSRDVKDAAIKGADVDEASLDLPSALQGDQGPQGPPGEDGADGSPDTPAQVLDKLRSVDGAGSGLDADSVEGLGGADLVGAGDIVAMEGTAGAASDPGNVITLPPVEGDLQLRVRCIESAGETHAAIDARDLSGASGVLFFGATGSGGASPTAAFEAPPVTAGFSLVTKPETNASSFLNQTGTMVFTRFDGSGVVTVPFSVSASTGGGGFCTFAGVGIRGG